MEGVEQPCAAELQSAFYLISSESLLCAMLCVVQLLLSFSLYYCQLPCAADSVVQAAFHSLCCVSV